MLTPEQYLQIITFLQQNAHPRVAERIPSVPENVTDQVSVFLSIHLCIYIYIFKLHSWGLIYVILFDLGVGSALLSMNRALKVSLFIFHDFLCFLVSSTD